MDPGHASFDCPAQRQPVHEGHPDIGNHHVRLFIRDHGKRDLSVRRFSDQSEILIIPQRGGTDPFPGRNFVVYDKYFQQHGNSSFYR